MLQLSLIAKALKRSSKRSFCLREPVIGANWYKKPLNSPWSCRDEAVLQLVSVVTLRKGGKKVRLFKGWMNQGGTAKFKLSPLSI